MRSVKITNKITNREGCFKKYLNDISEIDTFTNEEEVKCAIKASNGDEKAINELVERNLRFVVSVAKQYETTNINLEDLVNEGNIGLVMAAKNYNPNTGFKFITYAVWWIRKLILEYISKNMRTIRLPANKLDSLSKYNQKIHKFEQKYGRTATANDIIDEAILDSGDDIDNKKISKLVDSISEIELINSFNMDSLDFPLGDNDGSTSLYETISDGNIKPTDYDINYSDLKKQIERLLKNLKQRDREIMIKFYGLYGTPQMPPKDIAKDYDLTTEMVRQINIKSLRKLRNLC